MTRQRWLAAKAGSICALASATALAAPTGMTHPSAELAPVRPKGSATPATNRASTAPRAGLSEQLREAADRHERAFQLYDEGAYEAALSELKRAYELAPTFRILYNLGVMSLGVHDHAGAMDYFERYLTEGADAIPDGVRAQVGDTLGELGELVGRVSIQVNVAGAELSVDDRSVGTAPLDRVLRLNAGSRRISARASGWLPDSQVVSLAGGDELRITLTLTEARATLPPPPPPKKPERTLPWLGFGATALLTAGSVVSGVEALSAQSDFDRKRRTLGITSSDLEQSDAKAFHWSVAADVLGLAALATGGYCLYLMLASPEAEPAEAGLDRGLRLELTATGGMLSGRF